MSGLRLDSWIQLGRSGVRRQNTDGGGLKDQQKTSNLPKPKASAWTSAYLSCHTECEEGMANESLRTEGRFRSNQRITADIKALQHYAESVAHKIRLFLVNDRVCHQFYIA